MSTAATEPGSSVRRRVPDPVARTDEHVVVDVDARSAYEAIWNADLTESSLARHLAAVAVLPQRIATRGNEPAPPSGARHAGLREALAEDSPWVLLADGAIIPRRP